MSYLTYECGLDGNENPDKACCDSCSGRACCYDLIEEGYGDDITESDHCIRCGDWWGDKGAICYECERYFCPGYWQNFFMFSPDCEDKREEAGEDLPWDTMEGVCPECFADHPAWWCDCDNSCNTSKTRWS